MSFSNLHPIQDKTRGTAQKSLGVREGYNLMVLDVEGYRHNLFLLALQIAKNINQSRKYWNWNHRCHVIEDDPDHIKKILIAASEFCVW